MSTMSHWTKPKQIQNGAVLVVSLLLLLVMTILALAGSQATRMQERMAGNARDMDLALQSAEAGIRAAEEFIDAQIDAPIPCDNASCDVFERSVLPSDLGSTDKSWWTANGTEYGTSGNQIAGDLLAKADPTFVLEEMEEVTDALSIPPTGPPPSRIYYRITSRSYGGTETAQAVLQTTYARRFN